MKNMSIEQYNELVKAESHDFVLLVKFGAEWCAPCRAMEKSLDKLETSPQPNILKINTDKNQLLTDSLNICSIPTIILYYQGIRKDVIVGCRNTEEIQKLVEKARK